MLAPGDRLQLKANGETITGRKLANGELVTVKAILPDGRIRLADGRILERHYREFVHGYAVTSYVSQGKTVDYVLFSDSAVKAASNDQQWYVTTSRGRKGIRIFTSDKLQLRENIVRSGRRILALELTNTTVQAIQQNPRHQSRLSMNHQNLRGFTVLNQLRLRKTSEMNSNEKQNQRSNIRVR